jgi:crotonobetainyl-CoA:carnitine CoA-transferase CaiB-like acyl-CoA transferase
MTETTAAGGPENPGPLAGFRILDLTTVLLGPYATQILADYGADVIKVETLQGDPVRPNGSFRHPDKASLYLAVNRNKRAIAIDLKTAEGRELLWTLIDSADVLVHNLRPSSIEGLGFTYSAVAKRNPRLVYCFSTGFGSAGPDAEKPAYDDIIQSGSGIAALNGQGGGKPDYVPTVMADKTAGLMLSQAIVTALLARERTGRGQSVEVPMLESLVSFIMVEHLGGLTFEPPVAPAGYARLMAGGRQPAPTKDGFMTVLPYTGKHWNAFLKAAGYPQLIEKYEVNDPVRLYANVKLLYGELRKITTERTTAEWMKICEECDIPASPMYSLDELPEHPHLKAVGLFKTMEHPTEGTIRYVDSPVVFSDTPASVRSGAPSIGQHTDEILREAGCDEARIAALRSRRIVA